MSKSVLGVNLVKAIYKLDIYKFYRTNIWTKNSADPAKYTDIWYIFFPVYCLLSKLLKRCPFITSAEDVGSFPIFWGWLTEVGNIGKFFWQNYQISFLSQPKSMHSYFECIFNISDIVRLYCVLSMTSMITVWKFCI